MLESKALLSNNVFHSPMTAVINYMYHSLMTAKLGHFDIFDMLFPFLASV